MVGWTAEEDELLRSAVAVHGEVDHWKDIAAQVPGRSNKACRKRWLHSLSPSVKKSAWSPGEDRRLLDQYAKCGPKWSQIARQIPGRTDDACSKRYREALDPSLKKDEWTPAEDERLRQAHEQLGSRWGNISQELNRSSLSCRNRWRLLERRSSRTQPNAAPEPRVYDSMHVAPENPLISDLSLPLYQPGPFSEFHSSAALLHESVRCSQLELAPAQHSSFSSLRHALSPSDASPTLSSGTDTLSPTDNSQSDLLPSLPELAENSLAAFQLSESIMYDSQFPSIYSNSIYDGWPAFRNFELNSHVFPPWETVPELSYDSQSSLSPDSPPLSLVSSLVDGSQYEEYNQSSPISLQLFTLPSPTSPPVSLGSSGLHLSPSVQTGEISVEAGAFLPACGLGELLACSERSPQPIEATALLSAPDASEVTAYNLQTRSTKRRRKYTTSRKVQNGLCRLSSQLPLSPDPSILPYACGYSQCWPPGASMGIARFVTSKDLSEHVKAEHAEDKSCQRPFKCALDGCGKDWKSVNGLQYHLQISAAHFRQAVNEKLSEDQATDVEDETPTANSCEPSFQDNSPQQKLFACEHPGCTKEYRQISGLRYHEQHGHPEDIPAQLKDIPPMLAKRVANKSCNRKRRRQMSTSLSTVQKIPRTQQDDA